MVIITGVNGMDFTTASVGSDANTKHGRVHPVDVLGCTGT